MSEKLILFSTTHLVTSATVVALIGGAVYICRRQNIILGKAYSLFLVVYYFADALVRHQIKALTPIEYVPLHICSILFFIGAFAHYKKNKLAHQISFFWTFAMTLQSLITPTLKDGVYTLEFFRYFLTHGLIIFNATYVISVLRIKITFRSLINSFVALQALLVVAFVTNLAFDVNFIFLKEKPPSPTPVDLLGPWPWYIGGVDLALLLIFILLYFVMRLFNINKDQAN